MIRNTVIHYDHFGEAIPPARRLSNVNIFDPYIQLQLPQLPIVHPYNPDGGFDQVERLPGGVPIFSIAVALDASTPLALPAGVLSILNQQGIAPAQLELFFCVQNMPWKNAQLLFRPHPWLHTDAPLVGNYSKSSDVLTGVFAIGSEISHLVNITGVSTHPGTANHMVLSAAQMLINDVEDPSQTHCFYSLCIEPATKKAALTLHWLVNDQDHAQIQRILPSINTLPQFIMLATTQLQYSVLNGTAGSDSWTPLLALNALIGARLQPPSHGNLLRYCLSEQSVTRLLAPISVISNQSTNASLNVLDQEGYAPIHRAALGNDLNLTRDLLSRRASVDFPNKDNYTALQIAANFGYVALAEVLYQAGADPNRVENNEGLSAREFAQKTGHTNIVALFRQPRSTQSSTSTMLPPAFILAPTVASAPMPALTTSCTPASTPPVSLIATSNQSTNASLNVLDHEGYAPIHRAALGNDLNLTRDLLSRRASVDFPNKDNYTALQIAANFGYAALAEVLYQAGADPNRVENNERLSAREFAQKTGHTNIVALFRQPRNMPQVTFTPRRDAAQTTNNSTGLAPDKKKGNKWTLS
jgi:ankyrin repeat protein